MKLLIQFYAQNIMYRYTFITALLMILLCHSCLLKAQPLVSYSFTYFTPETHYQELTGDISINNDTAWYNDEHNWKIPLGFTFNLFGLATDTMYMVTGAILSDRPDSGNPAQQHNFLSSLGFIYDKVWYPFYHFHIADTAYFDTLTTIWSQSPLSYKIEGAAPNRITKIQYKNAGFEADSTDSDYINMQVWLYEGSNVIEYRYGPQRTSPGIYNSAPGPIAWLLNNAIFNISAPCERDFTLSGPAANPHLSYGYADTVNFATDTFSLTGTPPENIVYRFVPYMDTSGSVTDTTGPDHTAIHILTPEIAAFKVFPNPATDFINIVHKGINNGTMMMYNVTGKLIMQKELSGLDKVYIGYLPSAMYFIKIESPGFASYTARVIKQ